MYNRYVPQSDGSYRRSCIPDHIPKKQTPVHTGNKPQALPQPQCVPEAVTETPGTGCSVSGAAQRRSAKGPGGERSAPPATVSDFLKNLLPGSFDTGDLLVVVLLLLMAGDCKENRESTLLTLLLYLLM